MRRAAPFVLDEDFRFGDEGARRRGDVVAAGPDDDRDRARAGVFESGERVGDHRPAGDRVQRLGDRRAHAHALAGGEDDAEAGTGGGGGDSWAGSWRGRRGGRSVRRVAERLSGFGRTVENPGRRLAAQ